MKRLLPDFGGDNWTSSNRRLPNFDRPRSEGPADFSYYDRDKRLAEHLQLEPINENRKFLIEVKSTAQADTKAFFLSERQFALVKPDSLTDLISSRPRIFIGKKIRL